jgi:ribosomal protein L24
MERKMKIKFRDVSSGIVEARAVVEMQPGIFINEITILSRNGKLEVEMPQKSFKGKDGRMHYLEIITFADENQETLWKMEIKDEFNKWRKSNKKVLVYES